MKSIGNCHFLVVLVYYIACLAITFASPVLKLAGAPDECERRWIAYDIGELSDIPKCRPAMPETSLHQGDMMLTPHMKAVTDEMLNPTRTLDGGMRAAATGVRHWTQFMEEGHYIVPYYFFNITDSARRAVRRAFDAYRESTAIRFRRRTTERNYIKFISGEGCWSFVGRERFTENLLSLGEGCDFKGTAIHEIMHALGFFHEQSRPDRDLYVRIVKSNILPEALENFVKYDSSKVYSYGIPYDVGSIMHYGSFEFSRNGGATITLPNGRKLPNFARNTFSQSDIDQINLLYPYGHAAQPITNISTYLFVFFLHIIVFECEMW